MRLDLSRFQKACLQSHKGDCGLESTGRRKVGRPEQTWRRSIGAEVSDTAKITWTKLRRTTLFDGGVLSWPYVLQGIKRINTGKSIRLRCN
ncbi:hypothetical protein ElyMa_003033300 [Elysia marginata]|uniref:PNPLA domain-containing protein n=1 Tax=Elysia marginata TaxID=1093978 RepID=A0AAV4IHU2_9GAST|nr:hypothetical protein ElyMa_003033300 [Elysia marginata]